MSPELSSGDSPDLIRLFRHLGKPSNYAILQALLEKDDTPSGLAERLQWSHSTIRSQLGLLHKLGFLNKRSDGRHRIYNIRKKLPSLKHKLLVKLLEMESLETDHSIQLKNSLSEETVEKIRKLEKSLTGKKIEYLLSFLGHPGLTSVGREQEFLKNEIEKLNQEISNLKLHGK